MMEKKLFLIIIALSLAMLSGALGVGPGGCVDESLPSCTADSCLSDANCPSGTYCGVEQCCYCEDFVCNSQQERGCEPCLGEAEVCNSNFECCSNNCNLGHCCTPPQRPYWDPDNNECGVTSFTHKECRSGSCVEVDGQGADQCTSSDQCYYYDCNAAKQCVQFNAYPDQTNKCTSNSDCGSCTYQLSPPNCKDRKYCQSDGTWTAQDAQLYCANCPNICGDGACNCGENYFTCTKSECKLCTDKDNDGYGANPYTGKIWGCTYDGVDCNDIYRMVNPGAIEICSGGVDENCNGLIDCADPSCSSSPLCKANSCTSKDDCPSNPLCYDTGCSGGVCVNYNYKCGADNVCCFPQCLDDPDCVNSCPSMTPGQDNTLTFYPMPNVGVGNIRAYGNNGGIYRVLDMVSPTQFGAGLSNRWDDPGPWCDYPSFTRGYAIFDTSCIPDTSPIKSSFFNYTIESRSGSNPMSIWIDNTGYADSDKRWIVNQNAYPSNNGGTVLLYQQPSLGNEGVSYKISVPTQYIKKTNSTRFIIRMGNGANTDAAEAAALRDCSWSPLACGDTSGCTCRYDNRGTNCGPADPCYYGAGEGTPPMCYCTYGSPYPASTGTHGCYDYAWTAGAWQPTSPLLQVTFCAPNCIVQCSQPDGCGGTCANTDYNSGYLTNCDSTDKCYDALGSSYGVNRTVLPGYNSCAQTNYSACGKETICWDNIDNDCDFMKDCLDIDCQTGIEICNNSMDDDCDFLIDCKDPECNSTDYTIVNSCPSCPRQENCTNGRDDDCDTLPDCLDPDCMGKCEFGCIAPENCTNGRDDDCDTAIDGRDTLQCPEGSGNITTSIYRNCNDGLQNDAWNDTPETLIDRDDDGCCDRCIATGYHFDTTFRNNCGTPDCNCGTQKFEWETTDPTKPQQPYCCGDDANEYYKTSPLAPGVTACCNNASHCVDQEGKCQIGKEEDGPLCMNGRDDDCDGYIDGADVNCTGIVQGTVRDENQNPISGATVKASPPGTTAANEKTAATGPDGKYTIPDAIVGEYSFIARKEGYDDGIKTVAVNSKATTTADFKLKNGSCHADCTDYYGNCNPDCEGKTFINEQGIQDTCHFETTLCYNRPKGFMATEEYTENSKKMIKQYACCENKPEDYQAIKAKVTGNVKNLYDYTIQVQYEGKNAILHIVVFNPNE